MGKTIYLDNGSTTKVHKEAAKEMEKFFFEKYGNPSSSHAMGDAARKALIEAKKRIASEIGAKPWEIIFISGGTEANNFALFGLAKANSKKRKIIISSIEHSSIYEPSMDLKKRGYEIIEIPVNNAGLLDINYLERVIDSEVLLVSIIHANNEIGVIQDIKRIGEICRQRGALFHTDAVQSFGKIPLNVKEMNIGLLSASAHKIGGPKGVGFLYAREDVRIEPLIIGGGQEAGRRGGTENIPAIAGFSKALEITKKIDKNKIREIRDYFLDELEKIGGKINGSREERIYNNINISFLGKDAENMAMALSEKGIMCSTKSACLEKQKKENRVLKALGLSQKEAGGSLRFALNEEITKRDIDYVVEEIRKLIQ